MKVRGYVLLLVCCLAGSAHAAAYKCKDAAGKVTYSDSPCVQFNQKGDKIFDRGAGYNPLNEDEKRAFMIGVTRGCMTRRTQAGVSETRWRNYCDCSAEEAAKTVKIEEVRSIASNPNNKAMEARMHQLGAEAGKACSSHLTSPPPTPRKTQT
jgi:Domain of unknown function (DUF4124)